MLGLMMSTDLVVIQPAGGALAERGLNGKHLFERWLAGKSPNTVDAYRRDLVKFGDWYCRHFGVALDPGIVLEELLRAAPGTANEVAHEYKAAMLEEGLAPATVNRRLAALRSITNLAKLFGFVSWDLMVSDVPSEAYRDTTGPAPEQIEAVLSLAGSHPFKPKARRDVALIMLMFGNGLRVSECVNLDVEHLDLRAARLSIKGKGRREREILTLPHPTVKALSAWLASRGKAPGPLFVQVRKVGSGARKLKLLDARLSRDGVLGLCNAWGDALGFALRPHGLRHAHVTQVLEASNGNVRLASRSARHKKIETTMKYDDNRQDLAGQAAGLAAGLVRAKVDSLMSDDEGE